MSNNYVMGKILIILINMIRDIHYAETQYNFPYIFHVWQLSFVNLLQ